MPVEELVEIASSAYTNKQISDSENDICTLSAAACANNNNRFNPKNIYNLTINLDHRDSSLVYNSISDINMNQQCRRNQHSDDYDDYENENEDDDEDEEERDESFAAGENEEGVCRTPTMKYFQKKKAVSLDSDQNQIITSSHSNQNQRVMQNKMASSETYNYYFGNGGNKNSSISVPSTPKHLTSNKLKISGNEERGSSAYMYGRYSRKLGSFEENADDSNKLHVNQQSSSSTSKANLTASFQTLNVSSSNLKTLPEIMSINDFDQQSVIF